MPQKISEMELGRLKGGPSELPREIPGFRLCFSLFMA